jgi:hypothetical protein
MTVRNVSVTNYDDAVCIKPMNGGGLLSNCTSNVLVEDADITMGVGATIGSVPPNSQVNCIRDVTFRRITFHTPIKVHE